MRCRSWIFKFGMNVQLSVCLFLIGATVVSADGPSYRRSNDLGLDNRDEVNLLEKNSDIGRKVNEEIVDVLENVKNDLADDRNGDDDPDSFGHGELDDLDRDGEYEGLNDRRRTNDSISRRRRSPISRREQRYGGYGNARVGPGYGGSGGSGYGDRSAGYRISGGASYRGGSGRASYGGRSGGAGYRRNGGTGYRRSGEAGYRRGSGGQIGGGDNSYYERQSFNALYCLFTCCDCSDEYVDI